MYKISNYLFFLENNNIELIYSSLKNRHISIDKKISDKIKKGEFSDIEKDILDKLIEFEFIIPQEKDELNEIINNFNEYIDKEDMLYQVIQPSSNCQLGCNYCGQVHNKGSIDNDIESMIYERIKHNLLKKDYKEIYISWFGGEPLMGIKNLKSLTNKLRKLAYSKSIKYRAKMVTNGLSLKKEVFYDLVYNYQIKSFEITLDGTKKFHDERRHTKSGRSTFNIIIKNIEEIVNDKRFLESKVNINIRSNVDLNNSVDTFNLIELLDNKKILEKVNFYTAPIHSWGNDAHKKSMSSYEYADFEVKVLLDLINRGKKLQVIPMKRKDIVCMSLHNHSELFDSKGNVYNCSEISQVPVYTDDNYKYRIGNLKGDINKKLDNENRPFSTWNEDIKSNKVPCHSCKLLPICGGACPKLWTEDLSPCPSMKYNFEERMLIDFYQKKVLEKNN